jgi:hypothetical protein
MDVNFIIGITTHEIQQWQPLVVITGDGIVSMLNLKVEKRKSSIF